MTDARAEINLEVSTGFFRIATDELIYNITVLGGPAGSALPGGSVVAPPASSSDGITPLSPPEASPLPGGEAPSFAGDDFYRQVSNDIYKDIGQLAKSLNATIMDLPAEDRKMKRADLDEAGEKIEDAKNQLRDIVSMTERATMEIMDHVEKVQNQTDDVRELLAQLKDHRAFLQQEMEAEGDAPEDDDGSRELGGRIEGLEQKIRRVEELLVSMESEEPGLPEIEASPEEEREEQEEPEPEPREEPTVSRKRFLFELDTVFQTIYELCTNETVKGHISTAREKAGELFDYDAFVDSISARVTELEPDDDNFYTVPLGDVLQALTVSCSEKKIKNLFVKMDANQGEIFLDTALPLEVPPVEEVSEPAPDTDSGDAADESGEGEVGPESEDAGQSSPPDQADSRGPDPRVEEARALLAEALSQVEGIKQEVEAGRACKLNGGMSKEDQLDLFHKIESAFGVASNIYEDVTRITEALSFQDLSGQQILKIIKLLSDFQVQLLAIVVSFGSQLKSKELNATITPEESKRLAQEDVDRYLKTVTGDQEVEGPLDQDTVNKMLEEFGF